MKQIQAGKAIFAGQADKFSVKKMLQYDAIIRKYKRWDAKFVVKNMTTGNKIG